MEFPEPTSPAAVEALCKVVVIQLKDLDNDIIAVQQQLRMLKRERRRLIEEANDWHEEAFKNGLIEPRCPPWKMGG